jgi:hypothetical protein
MAWCLIREAQGQLYLTFGWWMHGRCFVNTHLLLLRVLFVAAEPVCIEDIVHSLLVRGEHQYSVSDLDGSGMKYDEERAFSCTPDGSTHST